MKKILLSLLFILTFVIIYPQDFFRGNFDKEKSYVIMMNPTVGNIEVVSFLVEKKLLDIDIRKINIVGVYHAGQEYDFKKTAEYLEKNKPEGFFLQEVRGALPEESLFSENECSGDFRLIFSNSVGVIFFGGQDIPPSVYGEDNLYSVTSDTVRHYFEVSFLFHLIGGSRNTAFVPLLEENPGYLVTGFCLGMQSMNVAAGGTLYQDIPAQIYNSFKPETNLGIGQTNLHRNYWQNITEDKQLMGYNLHRIQFTENPFFEKTVGLSGDLEPLIFSSHHQSVRDVGAGLQITALSPDGKVIEGLVHKEYPNVFSVQFHPEVSALYEDRSEVKFSPQDKPETIHRMLDGQSLKFHLKYWGYISSIIETQSK
jgi:putative glutamine amidotransferase